MSSQFLNLVQTMLIYWLSKGLSVIRIFWQISIHKNELSYLEYNSLVGGVTTIIFTLVCAFYVIYCSIPFVTRKNVELIYTNKIVKSDRELDLVKEQIGVAFGFQCQEGATCHYEDYGYSFILSVLNLTMVLKYWNGGGDIDAFIQTEVSVPLKMCEHSDFYNKVNSFLSNY